MSLRVSGQNTTNIGTAKTYHYRIDCNLEMSGVPYEIEPPRLDAMVNHRLTIEYYKCFFRKRWQPERSAHKQLNAKPSKQNKGIRPKSGQPSRYCGLQNFKSLAKSTMGGTNAGHNYL